MAKELINISYEDLQASHGEKAEGVWKSICKIGGFGDVPKSVGGGLDLSSLDKKVKAEIEKVLEEKK